MVRFYHRGLFVCRNVKPQRLRSIFWLFLFYPLFIRTDLPGQETLRSERPFLYYDQLQQNAFADMLLPKEQMLFTLVKGIQEEIARRHREGVPLAQLGMDDLVPPDEKLVDQYNRELEGVFSLLKEIETLENRAKRQADFEVLNTIASLKRQIREMVGAYSISDLMAEENADNTPENKAGDAPEKIESSKTSSLKTTDSGDLFEQWKYNRLLDSKLKQTKYELIHAKLLGSASPIQKERMFKQELQSAFLAYTKGNFALSRLLFSRLLNIYAEHRLDDVLFYAGESAYALNYLDDAQNFYRQLIQKYPGSEFRAKTLVKLFNVFYIYRDFQKLYKTYDTLQLFRTELDDNTWNTLTYLAAYAEFRNMQFEAAIRHFSLMDPSHPYYYPALYMAATCQVNLGQEDHAIQMYQKIVKELDGRQSNPVLGQIRNNALLKLGLSYYEKGENDRAIAILGRVSEGSDYYDLSVMGKAWSAYRAGRPGEALMNVEALFQTSAVSNYVYEAKLLAASAKELLGKKEEALSDLKRLYQTSRQDTPYSTSVDRGEDSDVEALMDPVSSMDRRSQTLMNEAKRIRQFMRGSSETRSGKNSVENQGGDSFAMLNRQLSNLDTLEREAQDRKDAATLSRIRAVRGEMLSLLKDETGSPQWTDEMGRDDELIRQLGLTQYLNYTFELLIQEVRREKELSIGDIEEISSLSSKARTQDQYDLGLRLEIQRDELEEYVSRLNQYEVWLLENIPQSTQMDISQWANFSGYGISNITFSRIKDLETRMASLSLAVHELDGVIHDKQLAFEQRIQGLLGDVDKIEQQMQREEKRRDTLEKERYFENQYFDKQPKETPAEPATDPGSRK